MTLIFGGAYMGKRDYAKAHCGVTSIETCAEGMPAFDSGCVASLEQFSLHCARQGKDAAAELAARHAQWKDHVLIARDISCGVVPLEAENRAWRQRTARLCQYLASEANQVSRIFCGLEQRLK